MLVINSPIAEQGKMNSKRQYLFTEEEFDEYSRNLLGVDEETHQLLLAEAEAELLAESGKCRHFGNR